MSAESHLVTPNAVSNLGGMMYFISPLIFDGALEADMYTWGPYDFEQGALGGYHDIMFFDASGDETDVIQTPFLLPVSNIGFGSSSNGYAGSQYGTSKMYISSLETSAGTTVPKLYKWRAALSPLDTSTTAVIEPFYQTQSQIFSKKVQIKEVRVYSQPWVADNSFSISLIGSSGQPITNGTKTFTSQNTDASAPMYIGSDYAWWTPEIAPTYTVGLLLINLGEANHVITKIEIDYAQGGQ